MINLTDIERAALHNNRQEFYKLTLVDKFGVEKCELEMINGSITCNSERAIKKTGTLTYRIPNKINKVEDFAPEDVKYILSDSGLTYAIGIYPTGELYSRDILETETSKYIGIIKIKDNGELYTLENGAGEEFTLIDNKGFTWSVGVDGAGLIYSEDTIYNRKIYYKFEPIQIDFLNDRVKVYMGIRINKTIKWWSKGLFVNIQPTVQNGIVSTKIYDETIIMQRTRILDDKVFLQGTNYGEVLSYLLVYCGIQNINIEVTNLTLPIAVILDSKKNVLEWFNYFAEQINYTSLYVDDDGFFTSRQYTEPSPSNVGYTYIANELSIITGDLNAFIDNYNVANVFRLIVAHPILGELTATYINDDPTDPYSIVNTNMHYYEKVIDNVAGQIELNNLAKKEAWFAKQLTEEISFQTLNMPNHTIGDVLELKHPNATGIVVENEWTMQLKSGSKMTHKVKRLVNLNE